jgi:hypothetical protein
MSTTVNHGVAAADAQGVTPEPGHPATHRSGAAGRRTQKILTRR